MSAQTHAPDCYGSGTCPSSCECGCHHGQIAGEHALTRKITRRFGLPTHVTYTCQGCEFTVTDTGDEAKRAWLRHLLSVEVGA